MRLCVANTCSLVLTTGMDIEALKRVSEVRQQLASGQARARRLTLRMSLREVAEALNTTAGAVSRWETGKRQPRTAVALQLASIYGIQHADAREKAA